MTMQLTRDDEITSSEPIINYDDIAPRLAVLRPWHVEDTRVPETAFTDPTVGAFASYLSAATFTALANVRALLADLTELPLPLEVTEYTDESDEQAALRELEAEMRYLHKASGRASAISDDHMPEFCEDELCDAYGHDAIEALWSYLKWDEIRAAREMDMTETTYRGGTYYLTP
jgi:hypothetical protein